MLLWSSGFIGAKLGLPFAEPLSFLLVRYLCVIVLLTLIAVAMAAPWPRDLRQTLHIAASGILIHALYLGGVFTAIHRGLPAGITAMIVGLQPLLTAVGAGALLAERVSPRQWVGLALGFGGVAMIVAHKTGAVPTTQLAAMATPAVLALLGITLGTLYQKRFCPRFDLRTGSVIQFIASALITLPFALASEAMDIAWTAQFTFALGWLVLVLSIGAITLLNLLIRSGSAVNVARLFYLTPPTTAVLAWAIFGETLTGLALGGMVLAVAGVWMARAR